MGFKTESFLADCIALLKTENARKGIQGLMESHFSDPAAVMSALGEPQRSQIEKLYVSEALTVINVIWAPGMTLLPHNHNMWALIGVYCGREDNIFWRRVKGNQPGSGANTIEAAGARSLGPGEVMPLGRDIIHSVTNPTPEFTGAIHVYGGNFFENRRSEWEPLSLTERPYDIDRNLQFFEAQNALLALKRSL